MWSTPARGENLGIISCNTTHDAIRTAIRTEKMLNHDALLKIIIQQSNPSLWINLRMGQYGSCFIANFVKS